jgi:hypothetical protein
VVAKKALKQPGFSPDPRDIQEGKPSSDGPPVSLDAFLGLSKYLVHFLKHLNFVHVGKEK